MKNDAQQPHLKELGVLISPIKFLCDGKRTTSESLSFSYGSLGKMITSFNAVCAPEAISITLL